ncbi:MAG: Lpg1974 family pore-forming outer membrane protein [Pirellulales bacterium]
MLRQSALLLIGLAAWHGALASPALGQSAGRRLQASQGRRIDRSLRLANAEELPSPGAPGMGPGAEELNAMPESYEGPSLLADEQAWDEAMPEDSAPAFGAAGYPRGRVGLRGHPYSWFVGGEVLMVRPRFSEAEAFVRHEEITTEDRSIVNDQAVQFNFNYTANYRVYGGVRLNDCGNELRFAYWRLSGDAQTGATVPDGQNVTYEGYFNDQISLPGESLTTRLQVTANIYDVEFTKPIAYNYGDACNPCGPQCPRWDLRWLIGLRVGEVGRSLTSRTADATGATLVDGSIAAHFLGVGPRLGLEGRRYLGKQGNFWIQGKGSASLLFGSYDVTMQSTQPLGLTTAENNSVANLQRAVPMLEIEIGATWRPTKCLCLSAGWLVQSWFDLGFSEDVSATCCPDIFPASRDDANLLSFDGLYLRAEYCF